MWLKPRWGRSERSVAAGGDRRELMRASWMCSLWRKDAPIWTFDPGVVDSAPGFGYAMKQFASCHNNSRRSSGITEGQNRTDSRNLIASINRDASKTEYSETRSPLLRTNSRASSTISDDKKACQETTYARLESCRHRQVKAKLRKHARVSASASSPNKPDPYSSFTWGVPKSTL